MIPSGFKGSRIQGFTKAQNYKELKEIKEWRGDAHL
jgi:hypothetical protein